jgi:biopolymer transport protein TolR
MSCRPAPGIRLALDESFAWAASRSAGLAGDENMGIVVRNEGAKVTSDINVTPMVDVMLVLLIIFMVVTPMLQKDISVDLTKVNNPEQMPDADKDDAVVVAITHNGYVFLGRDRVAPDDLTNKVKDRLANQVNKRVFVRADARAKYKDVVAVVDNIRSAGVDQLGLLTDQKQENPNPGAPAPALKPLPAESGQ